MKLVGNQPRQPPVAKQHVATVPIDLQPGSNPSAFVNRMANICKLTIHHRITEQKWITFSFSTVLLILLKTPLTLLF